MIVTSNKCEGLGAATSIQNLYKMEAVWKMMENVTKSLCDGGKSQWDIQVWMWEEETLEWRIRKKWEKMVIWKVFDGESWSLSEWLRIEEKHDHKNHIHYKIVKIIIWLILLVIMHKKMSIFSGSSIRRTREIGTNVISFWGIASMTSSLGGPWTGRIGSGPV